MATSDEIGAYLQANGAGTLGTDIFIGLLPDTPDNCIAVIEYAGGGGMYTYGAGGAKLEQARFQITARNASYSTGRAKIDQVYKLLDAVIEADLSGVRHHRIEALQPPSMMPLDLNNRYLLSCNFQTTKDVS